MDDLEVKDLFAMFAMCGLLAKGGYNMSISTQAYVIANEMIEARKPLESGLPDLTKKRTRK